MERWKGSAERNLFCPPPQAPAPAPAPQRQHQHQHQHQHRHHDQYQHLLAKMELRDLKTNVLRRRCMVLPLDCVDRQGVNHVVRMRLMLPNDLDFRFLRCSSCKTFSAKLGAQCYPTCIEEPKTGFRSFSSLGPTCNTCNALMAPYTWPKLRSRRLPMLQNVVPYGSFIWVSRHL